MLHHISFHEVVDLVDGATKVAPKNFYHTWYGWVSKDTLHITSRSGATTRPIWHFSVRANGGARMFFKNTTGAAYCYVRPGANSRLEEVVFALNPHARVECVDGVSTEMLTRGSGCSHSTARNAPWYTIYTDGLAEMIREADTVQEHGNQYHIGCPTESDTQKITGGTYAVQWGQGHGPVHVIVTKEGHEGAVAAILAADGIRRIGSSAGNQYWKPEEHLPVLLGLLEEMATGHPLPESIRERVVEIAAPYGTAISGVDQGLVDRARYFHPEEVGYRATTDKVVAHLRTEMRCHIAKDGDMVLLLRKGEDPNSEKLFGWEGKARDYGPRFPEGLPTSAGWPMWVEECVRKECARAGHHDVRYVMENLQTAKDLAVVVFREENAKYWGYTPDFVRFHNGQDPNTGFGRVQWNRWFAR